MALAEREQKHVETVKTTLRVRFNVPVFLRRRATSFLLFICQFIRRGTMVECKELKFTSIRRRHLKSDHVIGDSQSEQRGSVLHKPAARRQKKHN